MVHLHIFFFPLMAQGHAIPTLEMAKLFRSRSVKATIISTPAFSEPVKRAQESGIDVGLKIIEFPPKESGLPDHVVSLDLADTDELVTEFGKAVALLREPFEKLIRELKPDCVVSDMFLPWTVDSAAKFGIPRFVFHGTSYLALCVAEQMRCEKPFKNVSSDSELFFLHNLPHQLGFVRSQVFTDEFEEIESDFAKVLKLARESDFRSYGVLVNSFYELEPDYVNHYRTVLERKAWHVGPLFLYNHGAEEKANRGKKSGIDAHECLTWLDSKKLQSVVYACFGSIATFTPSQLRETAIGLEASGQDFIWVVRKGKNEEENEDWLLEGFEERMKGKGLIIRGWAPQLLILDHPAVGAFVTHCGWNSTLEGLCAGVPMVTWPVFAEQFFNEKLVTDVLRTGISVGNKKWQRVANEGVPSEAVAKALQDVMVGEEAMEMRSRAKNYKEMARMAVEEGGSSYNALSSLIEELSNLGTSRKHDLN